MNLRLAAALGLVALVRPIFSIAGADEPGPLVLTALIGVVWIAAAVLLEVANPVGTLAVAGVAYALLAILLNLSLQPFLDSAETIPFAGYVAMPLFNALQGAVLGLIAWAIQRAIRRRAPR